MIGSSIQAQTYADNKPEELFPPAVIKKIDINKLRQVNYEPTGSSQLFKADLEVGKTSLTAIEGDLIPEPSMPSRTEPLHHNIVDTSLLEQSHKTMAKLTPKAQQILRIHFVNQILSDLKQIQHHCNLPMAGVYANSLLHTMQTMRDLLPFDPYLELIMALHDALSFQNNWINYNIDQYKGAYEILMKLAQMEYINDEKVEKAIIKLEEIGFDTTPFEISAEDCEL